MHRRQFLSSGIAAVAGSAALALPFPSAAQEAADDAALVRELLEALHPGLYRYQSPREFAERWEAFAEQWRGTDSLETRYLILSRLLSQIRCGHSYANFFNQSNGIGSALFERPTRLPFTFRWIGDAMVVTGNQTGAGGRDPVWLPDGSVVKAVDGVPVADIYRRLLPYVRVDGHNDGKARSLLSVGGTDSIEFFDIFHGLVFGAPRGGTFNLHYSAPGTGSDVWADVPALTMAERQAMSGIATPDRDAPQWQWTMRDDGIAVLRMDGWALYNSRWDWRGWLNGRLDSLSGARGLIIDIRRNEGGLDCGDAILARLTDRSLPGRAGRKLVRYSSVPERLRPALDTWDRSFLDWGARATAHDARYFELDRGSGDQAITPIAPRLTVPVAILTSSENSSATFRFADIAKTYRLATLVGNTTGGNRRGINGGAFFFARLPQSGIEFDIPLIGYFPDEPQPDAGIRPDIAVSETAADIAAERDAVLERAVRHIVAT